jgi:hypothetical protein
MAGVAPNVHAQITRRLNVMREQLRKVFTATGTRSIKQLKEFIILGKERPGICFGPSEVNNGLSRTMDFNHTPDWGSPTQQQFRVQHVNGKDHLFATEKIISDWEKLNLYLINLRFPRQFIPGPIRAELEAEHYPFSPIDNRINRRSDGLLWISLLPDDLMDVIDSHLGVPIWIDVEELFENAKRLRQLREWKRGLQQGHAGRSLLLNLPEEGPANLVGTFVTGARRNGGLRPGLHNLNIAGQEQVLIDRLTPTMPEVDVELPDAYRHRGHYLDEVRHSVREYHAYLDRTFGPAVPAVAAAEARRRAAAVGPAGAGAGAPRTRKRKIRNRKTRKNRK